MGKIIKAIVDGVIDVVEAVVDAVVDIVEAVWDGIAMPVLEEVFSWIGIEDETVVSTDKVSTKIMGGIAPELIDNAKVQAVLEFTKTDSSFFPALMRNTGSARTQVRSFFNTGETQYTHGLPTMSAKGHAMNFADAKYAVDTEYGVDSVILVATPAAPDAEEKVMNAIQDSPYFFKPGLRTLTFPDAWGNDREWTYDSIIDNAIDYVVNISRDTVTTTVGIVGAGHVAEGESASYTVVLSHPVPAGGSFDVLIAYGGTAVDGADYFGTYLVTVPENSSSVDFQVVTADNVQTASDKTILVSIDTVDNSDNYFDHLVVSSSEGTVSTQIVDDDSGPLLVTHYTEVPQSESLLTFPVTLLEATPGSFTIDYSFVDGLAEGGLDYNNSGGTLTFSGTFLEVQNITIPLSADTAVGDREDFSVVFSNCSDPSVEYMSNKVVIYNSEYSPESQLDTLTDSFVVGFIPSFQKVVIHYYENGGDPQDWVIWHYPVVSNLYPDLVHREQTISDFDMLPVVILRRNKVNLADNSAEYDSAKRMLSLLRIDIDDILSSIDAENSGSSDVDDCYLNFSVSPSDNQRVVAKILFLTFKLLHVDYSLRSTANKFFAYFKEQDIQNAIVWTDFSWEEDVAGGTAQTGVEVGDYHNAIFQPFDEDEPKQLILRYQKTATTYDRLTITGLNALYTIAYGGYHHITPKTVSDEAFTIPVSNYVYSQLNHMEMLEVYGYMLRLDFNAIVLTDLEWYQTEAFADLFKFAMVAITFLSFGSATSLTSVAWSLFSKWLVFELVIWVAEETGNEVLAAFIGVVAAVVLGGGVTDLNFGELLNAEDLLKITTDFADNLGTSLSVITEELAEELKDLTEEYEERLDDMLNLTEDENKDLDAKFLLSLQSVNTQLYKAIQNQYDYDNIFNGIDQATSGFVDNKLNTTGVI